MLFIEGIVENCEKDSPLLGEVEVDVPLPPVISYWQSYFGVTRVQGKRGRGASGKTIVFGMLKREGKGFIQR